ncbi:MAG: LacI family transcriptional regulator [Treponema sp.]|jgi:DNA-binding LacI/PurR family transcriptional regulator|nr:LacI family transcriptional regulator [Treponema sp.]
MATIKDVAALAKVSISTVSYAINGTRPISVEKKASIQAAMEKLNFRPHAIARSLASKRTRIIAVLFPVLEHGIGLSDLSLIMEAAKNTVKQGYHLVIWTLQDNTENELEQLIHQELVDGIILMEVHKMDVRIPVLKKAGIPFILVGQDETVADESYVDVDFLNTMTRCFTYLKDLGHRNFIFINQSRESYRTGYGPVCRTHAVFHSLCRNYEITGKEYFCKSNPSTAYTLVEKILKEQPDVTAFIVMNDRTIPGIIRGVEKKNFFIPRDISIVSIVSSGSAANLFLPSITAFEMDTKTIMEQVTSRLIAKLEGCYADSPPPLVPCVLRERESSGKRR